MSKVRDIDPEFEGSVQLQILEREQNNCISPHEWSKPLQAFLDTRAGIINFHADRLGFDYHGIAPKFRAALLVRFAHRVRAAPVGLTLEFREWSQDDLRYRMHKDRLGFDINFGAGRLVGPRTKATTVAVLTVRFASRIRALPCKADLKVVVPRVPNHLR